MKISIKGNEITTLIFPLAPLKHKELQGIFPTFFSAIK